MKRSTMLFVFTVVGFLTTAAAYAESKVVEPGDEFAGKSYSELASEWSNWFVKEPLATNPALDPDGRFCDLNQKGKVWFLASTFEGVVDRTCEIPADRAIFVSVGGSFVSFAPEFPSAGDPCLQLGTSVARVRCDVNNDVPVAPGTTLAASIDGVAVNDLFAYRAQSQPGGFTLKAPNPSFLTDLGLPAGNRSPAVADGYFLLLKPLKPGVHTLNILKTNPDQSQAGVNYTLIITDEDDD